MASSSGQSQLPGELAPDRFDAAYGALRREGAELDQRLPELQARRGQIARILEEMVSVANAAIQTEPEPSSMESEERDQETGDGEVSAGGSVLSSNGRRPVDAAAVIRRLGDPPLSSSLMGTFGALFLIQADRGRSDATAREVATVNGAVDRSAAASIHTYLKRLQKLGLVEQVPRTKPLRYRLQARVLEAARQS